MVPTSAGPVRGVQDEQGVWSFRGIPYAAAPVGELRWRPPLPPDSWSKVFEARRFGPIAPQPPPTPGMALAGDPEDQSEDCLTLNIWTPGPRDGRRRPVMVWIHGGGFTGGTGASILYRGDRLAAAGDVVVVTFNYRLGALGFLAHRALARPGGGTMGANWGLLDQVAALRWVRANVAGFGGDPDNVTVFGESAGAMSVAALLVAPAARGLFRRAVVQSGPPYVHSPARAEQAASDLTSILGLGPPDRDTLVGVPAADLVAATSELQSRHSGRGEIPLPLLPAIDGGVLPGFPEAEIAAGRAAPVDLVVGTNRDELTMFAVSDPRFLSLDQEGLLAWAEALPGVDGRAALAHYRRVLAGRGEGTTPLDLWVAMGTDAVFRWPSLQMATAHHRAGNQVFVYLFTYETPIFGGILRSCHALEIPFVFGSVHDPRVAAFTGAGPAVPDLSQEMQRAWLSFARFGDPAAHNAGSWPPWDPVRRATRVFGPGGGLSLGPRDEELAAFAGVPRAAQDLQAGPLDGTIAAG